LTDLNKPVLHRIDDRLFQIDTLMFGRAGFTSVFLVKGERAAVFDSGVSVTADTVMAAVAAAGVRFQDVAYICLTHAHYDHAGGAHELLQRLKSVSADVKVACGEKPSVYLSRQDILDKLIISGRSTEGDRAGVMKPIDAQDLLVLKHEDILDLGGISIQALNAPGHANGHLVFSVPQSDFVFVSDACGLCGRTDHHNPLIVPTAFAPEYRQQTYLDTIRAIAATGVKRLGFAHFGVLSNPRPALLASIETTEWMQRLVREWVDGRRAYDEILMRMVERLSEPLMALYQDHERVVVTLKSLVAGMAHDLTRTA